MAPVLIVALDTANFMLALLLVTLGLVILFGLMNVINMAHGELFLLGAYAVVLVQRYGGGFWLALALAPLALAVIGLLIEELVIRHVYHRFIDTILATWGLNIIVVQVVTLYFGREIRFAESAIGRAVNVGGATYSEYRLVLLLLALVLGVAVWLVTQRTQIGIVARAVIMNEELAQALGINTRLARFVTFCLGAGLAALAGALLTPLISVHPNLGVPWLINAFMLVLVAGVSLANLALAALVLGGAQVLVSSYGNPVLGSLTIVILAVIILRFRTITI
jgi:branched-chain amino acid transport system permease protein